MFAFSVALILIPWPLTLAFSRSGPYPWFWTSVVAAMVCFGACFLWPAFRPRSGTPLQPDLPSTTYGSETRPGHGFICEEDQDSTFEI